MPEETYDYSIFGEDAETVRELSQRPEDIHKLLLTKRKANAEAKQLREALQESQTIGAQLSEDFDKLKETNSRERLLFRFKIEALKEGIRPDRLEAAARIAELESEPEADSTELASKAVKSLKESFPELFRNGESIPEVDNTGFSRQPSDPFIEAKHSGDPMAMLKALRKER
ncbi:hypothetical protein DRQ36_06520 [bacterium]|nr:MAG: hypothetical protein DRQ36_06520 [bacterium]